MAHGARSLLAKGKPGGVGGHADKIGCDALRTHDTGSSVVNEKPEETTGGVSADKIRCDELGAHDTRPSVVGGKP